MPLYKSQVSHTFLQLHLVYQPNTSQPPTASTSSSIHHLHVILATQLLPQGKRCTGERNSFPPQEMSTIVLTRYIHPYRSWSVAWFPLQIPSCSAWACYVILCNVCLKSPEICPHLSCMLFNLSDQNVVIIQPRRENKDIHFSYWATNPQSVLSSSISPRHDSLVIGDVIAMKQRSLVFLFICS